MVNRENYKLTRKFLQFKREVSQLSEQSVRRYKSALDHLLLWLDDIALVNIAKKSPPFANYLREYRTEKQTAPLGITSQKKILQVAKQFLHWAKANYPQ